LCLWPLRRHMRIIRWGIVVAVLVLALAMKAPVWFIIARIDVVGGHGWDRAVLIDLAIRHFSEWWLLGTKDNASWGADTWDACNEFVYQATSAGLLAFALFIFILSRSFGTIGKARKSVEGQRLEWFYWSLGAVLFAHSMGFWGIDYFDVIRLWWYLFLAMIPAAVAFTFPRPTKESAQPVVASEENTSLTQDESSVVEPVTWRSANVPSLKAAF
jgi:hypothetical protein